MNSCGRVDEVIIAARAGVPSAFELLYEAYGAQVAGYLRARGVDDPEDLANEVFLQVFRALPGFEGAEERFRAFLFTVAHRRLVVEYRRRSRRPSVVPSGLHTPDTASGNAETDALDRLAEQRVRERLDALAPDQRAVLLLRITGDLTTEQVAAALGKTCTAVKALQRRGLAALRRQLEREGVSL